MKTDAQFCIITPTAYLQKYATLSSTHLVLAHLVDKDDEYAEFYRNMQDCGDNIIMDNGAYELGESYKPDRLVELAQKCGAEVVVLPDYPYEPYDRTMRAAVRWMSTIKDKGLKTLFVPQSVEGDINGWIQSYQWAAENPDIDIIGMSILGIPNALPHIPKTYARVVMTRLLIDRGVFSFDKPHHYLGLNSTPNVEIPSLLAMKALTSCDSSNPVWAGINGLKYNTTNDCYLPISKKYLRPVDFDCKNTENEEIHDIIKYNVDITLDIFKNPMKYL